MSDIEFVYLIQGQDEEGSFYVDKGGETIPIGGGGVWIKNPLPYLTKEDVDNLQDVLDDTTGIRYNTIKLIKSPIISKEMERKKND